MTVSDWLQELAYAAPRFSDQRLSLLVAAVSWRWHLGGKCWDCGVPLDGIPRLHFSDCQFYDPADPRPGEDG